MALACAVTLSAPAALLAQTPKTPVPAAVAAAASPAAGPAPVSPQVGAGAATPASTPAATPGSPSPLNPTPGEFPKAQAAAASTELDELLSRALALRSRIAALTAALFSSRLRIELRAQGETVRTERLSVSLDGGVVYTASAQAAFERPELVFEHAVAPGPHVIGVEVERRDLIRPEFSTWQASRFVVVVPEKRTLWTRLDLEDESNMAQDFVEDEAGAYDLQIRLHAEVGD